MGCQWPRVLFSCFSAAAAAAAHFPARPSRGSKGLGFLGRRSFCAGCSANASHGGSQAGVTARSPVGTALYQGPPRQQPMTGRRQSPKLVSSSDPFLRLQGGLQRGRAQPLQAQPGSGQTGQARLGSSELLDRHIGRLCCLTSPSALIEAFKFQSHFQGSRG